MTNGLVRDIINEFHHSRGCREAVERQKKFFEKNSKKVLTKRKECGRILKLSERREAKAERRVDRTGTLKIEQQPKRINDP